MDTLYYIILVPMVYVAFAIFIFGTAFRIWKLYQQPKNPIALKIYPEQKPAWLWALHDAFLFPTIRRHNFPLWTALIIFHAGLLLLIIGHLELIKPFAVFQIIPHEVFVGRGFVGLFLCIALLFFLFRRFVSPNRDLSVFEDYFLLILLFLTVLFGSQMDWARRWYDYGELTVPNYRAYLMSLLTFKPDLPYEVTASGHSFMLVIHVFFANLFLMIFPFTKIMHSFFTIPMNKLRRG